MKTSIATGLTLTLLAISVPGCSNHDYSSLLLPEIRMPSDLFSRESVTPNPNGKPGAEAVFTNFNQTRTVVDTILVFPDASTATDALEEAKASLDSEVTGGKPAPLPVGTLGTLAIGRSPDGSRAVAVALFTQDNAFVTLEFASTLVNPVPDTFVLPIATLQASRVRDGLAS